MIEIEKTILLGILNSITKKEIYKFAKYVIVLDIKSDIQKEEIIDKVVSDVEGDEQKLELLLDFINEVQEWGRQHIFLYKSTPDDRKSYRAKTSDEITNILVSHKTRVKPNELKSIFIPAEVGFELYKVIHSPEKRLAFSWAERRIVRSRFEEGDYTDINGVEFHAWQTHTTRGILTLDWNLSTGQMMIRVSQSESKKAYENGKNFVMDFVKKVLLIPDNNWTQLDIRKSIAQIKDSGEVSTKKYNQETMSGGKQSLQARDKKHGIEIDSELTQASKAMKDKYASTYGNFFWLEDKDNNLESEVHTTIDSKSKSLLVFGIQSEETVRYIIGRIIHHIR